jgi:hypothetical protein
VSPANNRTPFQVQPSPALLRSSVKAQKPNDSAARETHADSARDEACTELFKSAAQTAESISENRKTVEERSEGVFQCRSGGVEQLVPNWNSFPKWDTKFAVAQPSLRIHRVGNPEDRSKEQVLLLNEPAQPPLPGGAGAWNGAEETSNERFQASQRRHGSTRDCTLAATVSGRSPCGRNRIGSDAARRRGAPGRDRNSTFGG